MASSVKKIGASIVLEGNKQYNAAIKEINANQKELKSEMKLVSATFEGQQNTIEALTAKQEVLAKQYDEQSKKVEVYSNALSHAVDVQTDAKSLVDDLGNELNEAKDAAEAAAKAYGEDSEEFEEASKQVAILEEELRKATQQQLAAEESVRKYQTASNEAEAALLDFGYQLEQNSQYLQEAEKSADGTASSIDEMGKAVKTAGEESETAGSAIAAVFGGVALERAAASLVRLTRRVTEGLIELGTEAAFAADNVATISTQTGISTRTLQQMQYATELMDVSVETITASMTRNLRSMGQAQKGTEDYVDAYKTLGIEITKADGSLRSSEEVFWEMIDALGAIQNPAEKDVLAMKLLGRSAQQLNPLIAIGSKGFKNLANEAESVGYVLSDETLDGLLETSDALERMSKRVDTLKKQIGAEFAPVMTETVEAMTDLVNKNSAEISETITGFMTDATKVISFLVENKDEIELFGTVALTAVATGFTMSKTAAIGATLAEEGYTLASAKAALASAVSVISHEGLGAALKDVAVSFNTAATSALGFNAALLVIPAALAAVALGIIAVANGALTMNDTVEVTHDLGEANKELAKSYSDVIDTSRESAKARKEEKQSIGETEYTAKALVERLKELIAESDGSTKSINRQKEVIAQLNAAYPELDICIDETTGALDRNIEAIEEQITTMREEQLVAAAQEDLMNIAREQYELTKEQTEAELLLKEAYEELGFTYTSLQEIDSQRLKSMRDAGQLTDEQYYRIGTLMGSVNSLSKAEEELSEEYQKANTYLQNHADIAEEAERANAGLKTATVQLGDSLVTIQKNADDLDDSIEKLQDSYDSAYNSAYNSLSGQAGLFGEVKKASAESMSTIAKNMEDQTKMINDYQEDLALLQEKAEKGLLDEGLLGYLESLGISGAGYVHNFAEASEEELQRVNESFAGLNEAKESTAELMAGMDTDFNATLEEMGAATETNLSGITESFDKSLGDTVEEVKSSGDEMKAAQKESLDKLKSTTLSELGMTTIASESKVYKSIGEAIVKSIAAGIKAKTPDALSAMNSLMTQMNSSAGGSSSGGGKSVTVNNNVTVNGASDPAAYASIFMKSAERAANMGGG